MKLTVLLKTVVIWMLLICLNPDTKAQCNYLPSTTSTFDTVSYTFSGGGFASFGCAPIDPTYWLSGNGISVTINFVNSQSYPTFRVWGMNTDDSASVTVNGLNYPLNLSTASYDAKVVCGLSPGPDGVAFANGKLVGANSPSLGNYSYQDVQLIATNVSSFTVASTAGAGWGFAGTSINCPLQTSATNELDDENLILVYPNPGHGEINIESLNSINEVNLRDLSGRIIFTRKLNENNFVLHDLKSGIYFLTATLDKRIFTTKIVVYE